MLFHLYFHHQIKNIFSSCFQIYQKSINFNMGGGYKNIKGIYVHRMGEYRYFTRKIKTFFKVVGNMLGILKETPPLY